MHGSSCNTAPGITACPDAGGRARTRPVSSQKARMLVGYGRHDGACSRFGCGDHLRSSSAALPLLCVLTGCIASAASLPTSAPKPVFSDQDVKKCTRIRTPELVTSGHGSHSPLTAAPPAVYWHVIATCCEGGHVESDSKVIMATSSDNGKSWGKTQYLGEGHGPNAIYDKVVDRLVVQYNSADDSKTYQIISSDHGHVWSKPEDLSRQLKACGHTGETAGQRVQTNTGRLLWYGGGADTGKYPSCFWWSDDHGKTYNASSVPVVKNEVSFTVVTHENNYSYIFGNGRSVFKDWKPHRIDYRSDDNGETWRRSESVLVDPMFEGADSSLERSLVYADGVMYTAEPKGTKAGPRMELAVSCSKDKGKSWPNSTNVGGTHSAGYSSLGWMGAHDRTLLIVWDHDEDDGEKNVGGAPLFQIIDTKWCEH